jgi:hypothetical protein
MTSLSLSLSLSLTRSLSLGLLDIDKILKYELTVEDGHRLVKENNRVLIWRHQVRQAAESLRLKKEAVGGFESGCFATRFDFIPGDLDSAD